MWKRFLLAKLLVRYPIWTSIAVAIVLVPTLFMMHHLWKVKNMDADLYHWDQPFHLDALPEMPYGEWGVPTPKQVSLGRKLFLDTILSGSQHLACANCHQPKRSFTDQQTFSKGDNGLLNTRHTPSLVNVGFQVKGFMWDGRIPTLEEQVIQAVANPLELNATWPEVLYRIRSNADYVLLFKDAFDLEDTDTIKSTHVAAAIAQFERTLISGRSRYDQYLTNKGTLSPLELRGKAIFFDESDTIPTGECAHCHEPPLFGHAQFFNNGLDELKNLNDAIDPGLGVHTENIFDYGKFKTPSLRNIAQTAPYMHDGRFQTLEEVIDHYDRGGHYAINASPNVRPLGLTNHDKQALIAFLKTLSDHTFLKNVEEPNVSYEY